MNYKLTILIPVNNDQTTYGIGKHEKKLLIVIFYCWSYISSKLRNRTRKQVSRIKRTV